MLANSSGLEVRSPVEVPVVLTLARVTAPVETLYTNKSAALFVSLIPFTKLVDRLMISSLIEARSCERFQLLGEACEDDAELKKLYRALWASEHGHYLSFIQLAEQLLPSDQVAARLASPHVRTLWRFWFNR